MLTLLTKLFTKQHRSMLDTYVQDGIVVVKQFNQSEV